MVRVVIIVSVAALFAAPRASAEPARGEVRLEAGLLTGGAVGSVRVGVAASERLYPEASGGFGFFGPVYALGLGYRFLTSGRLHLRSSAGLAYSTGERSPDGPATWLTLRVVEAELVLGARWVVYATVGGEMVVAPEAGEEDSPLDAGYLLPVLGLGVGARL